MIHHKETRQVEALNQVLNTQMATQQTQPTRQMEAQIRQLAVVLEMDAQRTQSTQETCQVEASDQVLSAQQDWTTTQLPVHCH